jgi:serine/threonine protein kinase
MRTLHVGDVVGDYTVIDVAGAGGMGTVYKIEHLITQRIEAMKLLPPSVSNDPDQVRRFEREIRLQARLHHPNIVGLYNAIRDGDSVALVMEFVEGESLQHKLAEGPLPLQTAVAYTLQVLQALAYAHGEGVIHRDVSPANIIITREQIPKLTDFGLARGATDLRLSTSGAPVGSPFYMSPEQVKGGHDLDPRADIYSMGAVLHEMLTGKKLFEAESAFDVMRAHVEAEPQPPSSLRAEIPQAFDQVVARAVAKDPVNRFSSAEEFRHALQSFSADAPVLPRQTGAKAWNPLPSPWASELRTLRPSILLVLVPAAMATGFCAVQFMPPIRHIAVTQTNVPAPAAAAKVVDPPATVVSPPPESPLPLDLAATPDMPASAEQPVHAAAPVQASAKERPPSRQPVRSTALHVTGSVQPLPEPPAPKRDLPAPVPTAEPTVPRQDLVEIPLPVVAPPLPTANAETAASPEPAAEKPQPTGNRLMRVLGKVNPFRKAAKHDPPKSQLKQD